MCYDMSGMFLAILKQCEVHTILMSNQQVIEYTTWRQYTFILVVYPPLHTAHVYCIDSHTYHYNHATVSIHISEGQQCFDCNSESLI